MYTNRHQREVFHVLSLQSLNKNTQYERIDEKVLSVIIKKFWHLYLTTALCYYANFKTELAPQNAFSKYN